MNLFKLPQAPENKYIESAEYDRKIQSAYHRMRPRIFVERFKNLNTMSQIGIIFFPIISITTSVSFIYGHIQEAINNLYASVILAIVLLSMVELTKNHLLSNALETHFSHSGKTLVTFVFAFLFSGLSFVMSFNGAEMLVKNLDNSKQTIKDSTSVQLTAINNSYDTQIADEKRKIDNINEMAKRQWHGLHTTQQTQLLSDLENNIKALREQKAKEKDLILSDKTVNLDKAEKSVNYNAWIFKLFAGIMEVLLIMSISFNVFYSYKAVREDMDLKDFRGDPAKQSTSVSNEFKSIPTNGQMQAPKIGLNSGNGSDRRIITGFLKESTANQSPIINDRVNDNQTHKRTCLNCGDEFDYKHWNKKYCSDSCRIEYWEHKTGKVLKLKPIK